jgi:predicted DNA repair protein MutK
MAGTSLLALIDDIASLLDDVALMTKAAAKKTVGVLGDDLALNAQQVAGVRAERELPVVWAVARGSLYNKAILVPLALLISAFLPWAITPLLMVGGLYLCFEGAEKLAHRFLHRAGETHEDETPLPDVDPAQMEKEKIKGAIRTDFVLSTEIIVIALGNITANNPPPPMLTQIATLTAIALLMTVGVYGFVAVIVKLDDLGLHLYGLGNRLAQSVGKVLLLAAPKLMKFLTIAGTVAMFMVGGGILSHGIPAMHHWAEALSVIPLGPTLLDTVAGLVAGFLVLGAVQWVQRLRKKTV